MKDIQLNPQNIVEPSEKVMKMYDAVNSFIAHKRDINSIKVADITSAAGIGKGTAYEYFSSKEEIIASALAYEYKRKITELVDHMFTKNGFKDRISDVMQWLYDNQEYNQLFSHIFRNIMGIDAICCHDFSFMADEDVAENQILFQGVTYINKIVSQLMAEGYDEGVFNESDICKRNIIVISGLIQYSSMLIMSRGKNIYGMTDEQLREFIYTNMLKCLN